MKHLALLAAVYAVIAALVLPGSLLASEDADPASGDTPAAETTPVEEAPAPPPEPAPAPEQPAPAPEPLAPAPEQPAAAPDQPAAAPAPPQEPRRKRKERISARAAASGSVAISDFQFTPAQITIDQGDSVTWTNNGPTAHSATAPDGSFDTGIFPAGQSRSHTFNDAGTFSYICTPHPNMHGTIVVRASQSGGETGDSGAGEAGGTGGSSDGGSSGAEASQNDGGPSLPNTGTDTGALLVLGALMLLLGVAVHRRARAEQPPPAGRIGW
ncbi:MAG TPA: cupredoxin family copper-binding protein [Thermoleophilaceae bacterium]